MKKYKTLFILSILFLFLLSSCETTKEKEARENRETKTRIELEEKRKQEAEATAYKLEEERIEKKKQVEIELKEKIVYDKYINNTLRNGSTPYAYCFGKNKSCSEWGCSQITVQTPSNSDVLVTIKKNGSVYRHAYIKASSSYTFEFPNGVYQPFFYYGKGWNPNKVMKQTNCGPLKGGFIDSEHFGKDNPQTLDNGILSYKLILQQNGNFSTKPSNSEEAF